MEYQTPINEELRNSFAIHNLERLSSYPPPELEVEDISLFDCKLSLKILEKWSDDNMESIKAAIENQVFGGKNDINWQNAFLPFMESAAVYLRDWGALREAWETYRIYKHGGGNDDAKNKAIARYHDAYQQLRELANKWGMDYMNLCDFVTDSPDGHPSWDGPFCGAFYTTDAQKDKPFIGVAFKGTNPLNLREVRVDYNYQLTDGGSLLPGTQVSIGVWTGLTGEFKDASQPTVRDVPVEVITEKLMVLAQRLSHPVDKLAYIHVTGHSLGGSYSTLFYPALAARIQRLDPFITVGDEYTFGAPRVGNEKFAIYNKDVVAFLPGQSWRIVNDQDIVPQVPPTTLKPKELDFYHIDEGEQIFKNKVPKHIPTEIGKPPPKPFPIFNPFRFPRIVIGSLYHLPNFYKDSLVYAIHHSNE